MTFNERYLPKRTYEYGTNNIQTPIGARDTGLRGIVTPLKQMRKSSMDGSLSFNRLFENKDMYKKFDSYEFPIIQKMDSGEFFFEPVRGRMHNMHTYIMKWFSLTNDFTIPHDHSYGYAKLNLDGYLMKITVPRLSEDIQDFEVNYVIPMKDIQFEQIVQDENTEIYKITPFERGKYPRITQLLQDKKFVEEYLSDILEK